MKWNKPLLEAWITPASLLAVFLVGFFGVGAIVTMTCSLIPKVAHASRAPQFRGQRYEVIHSRECMDTKKYPQYTDEDNANCFGGYPSVGVWDMDRFHDVVDQTDFICAYKGDVMSCFQVTPQTKQESR
jgi:hypothetical protein